MTFLVCYPPKGPKPTSRRGVARSYKLGFASKVVFPRNRRARRGGRRRARGVWRSKRGRYYTSSGGRRKRFSKRRWIPRSYSESRTDKGTMDMEFTATYNRFVAFDYERALWSGSAIKLYQYRMEDITAVSNVRRGYLALFHIKARDYTEPVSVNDRRCMDRLSFVTDSTGSVRFTIPNVPGYIREGVLTANGNGKYMRNGDRYVLKMISSGPIVYERMHIPSARTLDVHRPMQGRKRSLEEKTNVPLVTKRSRTEREEEKEKEEENEREREEERTIRARQSESARESVHSENRQRYHTTRKEPPPLVEGEIHPAGSLLSETTNPLEPFFRMTFNYTKNYNYTIIVK